MLTIERAAAGLPGYRIKLQGDRRFILAQHPGEVLAAVEHVIVDNPHMGHEITGCPICRRNAEDRKKEARREETRQRKDSATNIF